MKPRTSGINICLEERERKYDNRLAVNESTHGLPGTPLEGSPCAPLCSSVQRLCWSGWDRVRAGGDLGCPEAWQLNHSVAVLWKQRWGCQEVLRYYFRGFIRLVLEFPSSNHQRFWTLSGVNIFFCLERVPHIAHDFNRLHISRELVYSAKWVINILLYTQPWNGRLGRELRAQLAQPSHLTDGEMKAPKGEAFAWNHIVMDLNYGAPDSKSGMYSTQCNRLF